MGCHLQLFVSRSSGGFAWVGNKPPHPRYLHLEIVASQEIREVLKRKDIDAILCSQNRSARIDDDPAAQSLKLRHGA
jgi:hypothetical protein